MFSIGNHPKMASLPFHTLSPPQHHMLVNGIGIEFGAQFSRRKFIRHRNQHRQLMLTACTSDSSVHTDSSSNSSVFNLQNLKISLEKYKKIALYIPPIIIMKSQDTFNQAVASLPPGVILIKRQSGINLILGFCIGITCLVITIRIYVARKLSDKRPGSVADLVRRGQLRSDRRGISKPLKYEDPFNNPLVKIGNGNSTVEMCGKVYRLAPVTLTDEERTIHQKRRSRAYQWKRPKVFLKEGDSIPPGVDPESIRWIPANHPFATTVNDIDEDFAHTNVFQKHGVPFRIQAEHEALQKKLEALQNEQKLDKLGIDPANARDFERVFKTQSNSFERVEGSQNGQGSNISKSPKSDQMPESLDDNPDSP